MKTRITDLLGIEYPIIQGGMQWLARAELAAAVSNAGGIGLISATAFPDKESLVEEIHKCRELTDKPFGVNISMNPKSGLNKLTTEYIEAVCETGVKFVETSGRNPEDILPTLHDHGIKVMHKVPAARYALKAESIGADIVAVTGFECGGHPGNDDVSGNIVLQKTVQLVKKIPIVYSSGIVDGKGLVAALAMGADGIEMATRFIVCDESPAHPKYKQHLIDAQETDTMIIQRSIRNPSRVMKSSGAYKVLEMEANGATLEEMLTIISGKVGRKALFEADLDNCTFSAGQSVGLFNKGGSVAELFEEIVRTADESLENLQKAFCRK